MKPCLLCEDETDFNLKGQVLFNGEPRSFYITICSFCFDKFMEGKEGAREIRDEVIRQASGPEGLVLQ